MSAPSLPPASRPSRAGRRYWLVGSLLLAALAVGLFLALWPGLENWSWGGAASVGAWRERVALTGHEYTVESLAFSPDGTALASCDFTLGAPGTIKVWDAQKGEARLSWAVGAGGLLAVRFSPDGRTLASAATKAAYLWDAESGRQLAELHHRAGMIACVAFSPDGESLVTAGGREGAGEVRCWDADGRRQR
jgi:WD40 repeat protein